MTLGETSLHNLVIWFQLTYLKLRSHVFGYQVIEMDIERYRRNRGTMYSFGTVWEKSV